jgi:hypothetical protein
LLWVLAIDCVYHFALVELRPFQTWLKRPRARGPREKCASASKGFQRDKMSLRSSQRDKRVPFRRAAQRSAIEGIVYQRYDLSQLPTGEPPSPVSESAFVYILACSDGAIYVENAGDLRRRLAELGGLKGAKLTRDNPGGRLIYFEGRSRPRWHFSVNASSNAGAEPRNWP